MNFKLHASLLFLFCTITISSCKKDNSLADKSPVKKEITTPLDRAQDYLNKVVPVEIYNNFAFDAVQSYEKNGHVLAMLIPPKNSSVGTMAYIEFKNDSTKGNWVTFVRGSAFSNYSQLVSESFDSSEKQVVNIDSLGFMESVKQFKNRVLVQSTLNGRTAALAAPIATQGPSASTLFLMQSLGVGQMSIYEGVNELNYIQGPPPLDGGGGGSYPIYNDIIFEYADTPSIDLAKYFNCFNKLPDAGATYSVKLCVDIPRNNDPEIIAVGITPGHAFLTMTKKNGGQTVSQTFGFYPTSGAKSIYSESVESRIVDDGFHEFNASILSDNISLLDFNSVKNLTISYSRSMKYDLDDFNCADFVLECFNFIRPSPLKVPDTEKALIKYGTTPNGIYKKLKAMKDQGDVESSKIQIGVFTASASNGLCN